MPASKACYTFVADNEDTAKTENLNNNNNNYYGSVVDMNGEVKIKVSDPPPLPPLLVHPPSTDASHTLEKALNEADIALSKSAAAQDKEKQIIEHSDSSQPEQPDNDPWALPELQDTGLQWSELTPGGKVQRFFVVTFKLLALLSLLYLFICSLDFLSSSFRLVGGKYAGQVMSQSDLLRNPVVGLMLGILATVLLQSSSTSTSIVVTMVGSRLLEVHHAIPIVMGANIGTSVTNTIVSVVQAPDRNEFRRAFAAATVHDMFNWLTVIILLPIEVGTGYLESLTDAIINTQDWNTKSSANMEFLTVITKPFTNLIIRLDKKVIEEIANGSEEAMNKSMIKRCCDKVLNGSDCANKCKFALVDLEWSDSFVGVLLLGISLVCLCGCLILMVKILHSMLRGQIAKVIKTTINADYRFPFSILVGYIAIFIGCVMTILVQSSSIFTSALTPLAGIGVISLERMYPLTLGSNIGTTTTGLLAALATKGPALKFALQIAFCHLFFNISGILLFYPIPWTRFPIGLAKRLGNTTAQYRWFAIFYLIVMFLVLPGFVFALSWAGPVALACVGVPILIIFFFVIVINIVQSKRPSLLPLKLQNWNFMPECLHSLDPLDRLINRTFSVFKCCGKVLNPGTGGRHDAPAMGIRPNQSQINILSERRSSTPTESHGLNGLDNKAFFWQQNGKSHSQNTFL